MKKSIFVAATFSMVIGLSSFISGNVKKDLVNYNVDTTKSRIDWIASKKGDFHIGIVPIKSGSVSVDGGKLKGGKFVIDLTNLKVNDASAGRLTGHLKSADFFDVAKFADATYEISTVNYTSENTADVSGTLTIKGTAVPVKLLVNIRSADEKGFFGQAFLSIDKSLLGVAYKNTSNDVQLAIHIFGTKQP